VEVQSVVEALLGERDEVLDGLRRVLREELDPNLAAFSSAITPVCFTMLPF